MTNFPRLAGMLILLATHPVIAEDSTPSTDILGREAATISATLGNRLKTELMSAMQTGGPEKAIAICQFRAPELTREVAGDQGWRLRRTALRVRNPGNTPDAAERVALESFARRLAAGEDPARIEAQEIAIVDGKREFRYLKAIVTAEPCTLCHGNNIAPALAERIRQSYPADQATGFAAGELRGAFSLRKTLD